MPKKVTKEEWIERANKAHNNFYDYSLVDYKGMDFKIKIICPIHGIFEQRSGDHIRGFGCFKCKYEKLAKERSKSLEKFISEAKQVHGEKYDYSKVVYINNHTKVCIICPEHGEFWQTPNKHLLGSGCIKCSKLKDKIRIDKINNKRHEIIKNEFIKKAIEIHGNIYEYLTNYVSSNDKIQIKCKQCNTIFYQKPHAHLIGQGCPVCNQSKGENRISKLLTERNIRFILQYIFKNCRGKKRPLPFDFYLPDYNTCIEYDGEHHFKPVCFNGSSLDKAEKRFEITKLNDEIKNKFCKQNVINLIRISYKDDIGSKLNILV